MFISVCNDKNIFLVKEFSIQRDDEAPIKIFIICFILYQNRLLLLINDIKSKIQNQSERWIFKNITCKME